MTEFFAKYHDVLAWAGPSALVVIATVVQWAYGWRRLLDKITIALDHKVDREEFLQKTAEKMDSDAFHETRRTCVQEVLGAIEKERKKLEGDIKTVQGEISPLWKAHTSLSNKVAGSTGKLDEAVDTLKEAVKEIRTANGRRT